MQTKLIHGKVDESSEHISLFHKGVNVEPIAKMSLNESGDLIVELSKVFKNEGLMALKEINYYLIELERKNPWEYAKYRCRSMSNIYSEIQWAHYDCSKRKGRISTT